ncbi:uncharacterized protein LOC105257268 [Camponotus floridanus]|uniref:uncharacterized protein LOC105257268 n=1 Tax=Camponotus floridanus TaxID=104421 RepID=UPI00059D7D11|nr:uncharacterized protein LOC105257268 [Camponotus floridanus]
MFKIIAICCLMVTIAISFKKVDGQYVYKPAYIQKESVTSQSLEHIKASLENSLLGYLHSLQSVEASCSVVTHDAQKVVQEVKSIFDSCLKNSNETSVIESGIQKLTNMANDLKKNITEYVHEISTTCRKTPFNLTSCYGAIKTNIAKVSLKDLVVIAAAEVLKVVPGIQRLIPYVPNVKLCYEDLSHQFTPDYLKGIYHDLKNCTQSIQHLFGA